MEIPTAECMPSEGVTLAWASVPECPLSIFGSTLFRVRSRLVVCFAVSAALAVLTVIGPSYMAHAATLSACSGDQVASATTDARHVQVLASQQSAPGGPFDACCV